MKPSVAPVIALLSILALPTSLKAQCNVGSPAVMFGSTMGMSYIYISKMLDGSFVCRETMAMNARACFPDVTGTTASTLSADAYTSAVMPSCGWQCTCGTQMPMFSIDTTDGLPVELLEFEVDD